MFLIFQGDMSSMVSGHYGKPIVFLNDVLSFLVTAHQDRRPLQNAPSLFLDHLSLTAPRT